MKPQDFMVQDEARHRDISIRVYLPADTKPASVLLFSHGLGGSHTGRSFLDQHWAASGYPNHHRAILAISTAFWDAHLTGDSDAKVGLDGPGPRGVLETNDEWQRR